MFSLGTIIYLVARAAPRVGNVEESFRKETFHEKLDKLIAKIPLDKMDVFFNTCLEKIMRKTKLLLMKWDNLLTERLKKISKSGGIGIKEDKKNIFTSLEENKKEEDK
jgi:hypothetical protein